MSTSLLDPLLHHWHQLLSQWARDGSLSRAAQAALQLPGGSAQLENLLEHWGAGDFSGLPPVDVLPASAMAAARGAYAISTGTIFLNGDWLRSAPRDQSLAVLSEELGHHLDALLNDSDTQGDEGELLALLLHGNGSHSEVQQQMLQVEDDRGLVQVGGQELVVEQAGRVVSNPIPAASPGRTRHEWQNWLASAVLRSDGSVFTWGMPEAGGNSSGVDFDGPDNDLKVTQIFSSGTALIFGSNFFPSDESVLEGGAFTALRTDGSLVTWGSSEHGGNSSDVDFDGPANNLRVSKIFSTTSAFAALRSDGSVVSWGNPSQGANSTGIDFDGHTNNLSVSQIYTTYSAFAALRNDGSVVTWGEAGAGGDSSSVDFNGIDNNLSIVDIFSTYSAFAALRSDGSVITWGAAAYGGDSSAVDFDGISNNLFVTKIFSTASAFAALRSDGSVVSWGAAYAGGDSSSVDFDGLGNNLTVHDVFSTGGSFAAQRSDGSFIIWGQTDSDYELVTRVFDGASGNLSVNQFISYENGFAALRSDGSVAILHNYEWWDRFLDSSMDFDGPSNNLTVKKIFSTGDSFLALRSDGSIVTIGDFDFWRGWSFRRDYGLDLDGPSNALAVTDIMSSGYSLAALRSDGSVIHWSTLPWITDFDLNGAANNLTVTQLVSNRHAFAALRSDGSVVTWGLADAGGNSRGVDFDGPHNNLKISEIRSLGYGFSAIRDDGSVVTWGLSESSGLDLVGPNGSLTISSIALTDGDIYGLPYLYFYPTMYTTSASVLRSDGSVVSWGNPDIGGNSLEIDFDGPENNLIITQLVSNQQQFVALRSDGTVVTWGDPDYGYYGNSSSIDFNGTDNHLKVTQIFSNGLAFAALRSDGSVVGWGRSERLYDGNGGFYAIDIKLVDFNGPNDNLKVTKVSYTSLAFAAVRNDGSVVTWNDRLAGGDSSTVDFNGSEDNLKVTQIFSTASAFAALRDDGSVVTWGESGGNSSGIDFDGPTNNLVVTWIYSTNGAFAALRSDGSVVTWGTEYGGGDSSAVASQLSSGVNQIFSTDSAFAALKTDGSVVTWGTEYGGGDSSAVASDLRSGVSQIFSTEYAFAALKADGSVVTWGGGGDGAYGFGNWGGDSSAVASQLNNVVAFANPFTDDRLIFDADLPAVTLSVSPTAGVTEDGTSNLVYTFSRTGPISSALTVNYTVDGTAILGGDYGGIAASPATRTVIFDAGSSSATVTVDPTVDATIEADETVELTLAEGTGYTIATTAAVVGRILNDDKLDNNLPEITVAVGPITEVLEDGSEALLYTFTRKGSTVSPLGVNYALAGNATPGVDYTGINTSSTTQTLSFASGTDSATLRLIPTADPWIEPDETVLLTLLPGTDYTVGTTTAVSGTIRNDDVARLSHTTTDAGDNSFTLSGSAGGTARLKISLADAELNAPYDLALFTVDDLQGRIDGLNPNDPAYSRVALSKAKNVFSAISNLPQGFNPLAGSRVLELNSGDHFRFMLLEKGTLDTANQRGVISDILISSIRNVTISQFSPDQYILSWNDSVGNGKSRNLRVKFQATDEPKVLGSNFQDNKQGEMLDLSGVDPAKQVRASFVVNREAGYNNVVGFYKITDSFGSITDPVTGATLKPGDTGYTQTALRYRVAGMDLQVANQSTASGSSLMQAGSIFAPFIIANGSPEQLLDANPNNDVPVYFPFLAANSDGIDHIRLLADNTFGFEDLPGGGDLDCNDMIIAVGLTVI
jgi:alpha-tubulin suppressor-like RCC1 family protein